MVSCWLNRCTNAHGASCWAYSVREATNLGPIPSSVSSAGSAPPCRRVFRQDKKDSTVPKCPAKVSAAVSPRWGMPRANKKRGNVVWRPVLRVVMKFWMALVFHPSRPVSRAGALSCRSNRSAMLVIRPSSKNISSCFVPMPSRFRARRDTAWRMTSNCWAGQVARAMQRRWMSLPWRMASAPHTGQWWGKAKGAASACR